MSGGKIWNHTLFNNNPIIFKQKGFCFFIANQKTNFTDFFAGIIGLFMGLTPERWIQCIKGDLDCLPISGCFILADV